MTVDINGHQVEEGFAELLLDGETGEPISDEEYDEQKRRIEETPDEPNWEPLDENGDVVE